MTDEKILAKKGWAETCMSPYELSHEDGSIATGLAAYIVLYELRNDAKRKKKKKKRKEGLESEMKKYDVMKSPNGNLFLKVSDDYSLALGPKWASNPIDRDLSQTQYIKRSEITPMIRVGKIKFYKK